MEKGLAEMYYEAMDVRDIKIKKQKIVIILLSILLGISMGIIILLWNCAGALFDLMG